MAADRILCLLLSLIAILSNADGDDQCVYTVYVRTGLIPKSGTDSHIGLALADASGRAVSVPDLVSWGGLMGRGHDYFEWGGLDVFSGLGPCGLGAICRLNLTSDGSGPNHGWFCEEVEVAAAGPRAPCCQAAFAVQQWLAVDVAPYKLEAVVDRCGGWAGSTRRAMGH